MTFTVEPVQAILYACMTAAIVNASWIASLHAKQTILLGRLERAEENLREAQAQVHAQALRLAKVEAQGR